MCESNPCEAVKTNILGTKNVIDACLREDVKKVIFTSTGKNDTAEESGRSPLHVRVAQNTRGTIVEVVVVDIIEAVNACRNRRRSGRCTLTRR